MSKKRKPFRTIFIACEGKNTEPIYFERIKEEVEDNNEYAITIYPDRSDDSHKSDPIGLICEAQKNINNYDEVWAVFDKDGYTKHKEAVELAEKEIKGKKVNIAFSSISFEHWILLHFERSDYAFPKSANIILEKFQDNEKYYYEYDKKANIDIYPKIKSMTLNAIENAAWLRNIQSENLKTIPPFEVNPYTDVDVLIKRLLSISEDIIFVKVDSELNIKNCHFTFQIEEENLSLKLRNNQNISLVTNEISFFKKEEDTITEINIPNQQLTPNKNLLIDLAQEKFIIVKFRNVKLIYES
ncbi:RloB family protein [Seonamhaeicola maritimus]|uniref:RloB domain-containing protein n=1 Tax=Seonamhaeicola maritimus TaxID=2591822 RepID=A0A5C7GDM5_9FLAO|nr:RloB family protein [Seonamhaeicola maritimus]TXG34857.1 RloB domain-containing protein [Seonamhaeicola maritimus]